MAALSIPSAERRRDQRFELPGAVRLSVQEPVGTWEAALLDVSAGGLRLRASPAQLQAGGRLAVGLCVDVEVAVRHQTDADRSPLLHLHGRGQLVRRRPPATGVPEREPVEFGVRLEGPLALREEFPRVRLF